MKSRGNLSWWKGAFPDSAVNCKQPGVDGQDRRAMSVRQHEILSGESRTSFASQAAFSSHSVPPLCGRDSHPASVPGKPGTLWAVDEQAGSSIFALYLRLPLQWFLPCCLTGRLWYLEITHLTRDVTPCALCYCQAVNEESSCRGRGHLGFTFRGSCPGRWVTS